MQFKKLIALIITVCMIGTSAFVGGPVLSEKVPAAQKVVGDRSEEHTSELQSHSDLVCRLLLEKIKTDFAAYGLQLYQG